MSITGANTDNYLFNGMSPNQNDYQAFYGINERMMYYSLHCHDFYELYIHFRGANYYGIDNEVYLLEPNQLVILPPFHMHGLLCEEELRDYERAYLYLSPEVMESVGCGLVNLSGAIEELTRGNHFLFSMPPDAARECGRLLDALQKRGGAHSMWDRFAAYSYILPVMRIMLEAAQQSGGQLSTVEMNPMMHQVLVYINNHYTEPLTLKGLSALFNISVSTLSHEFYQYIRHSVYDYILYRRVMLAKQKLVTGLPLGEVCFQCGFGDYSNFLRAFHKVTGMPPSEYRKQIKNKQL